MTLEKVAKVIAERTGKEVSEITMETKIQDLNIDSLDMMELLMQFEDEFGYEIELGDNKITDIAGLVKLIDDAKGE